MSQIYSTDFLRNVLNEDVVEHLENGLTFINKIYGALTEQDSNYGYIREQIMKAQQNLELAEKEAQKRLKCLDEKIEVFTQDQGRLQQEMSNARQTLDTLNTEQTMNEIILKQSQHALGQAINILHSTQETLQQLEQKKLRGQIMTGVGAGLFIIPFAGWIIGATILIPGAVELSQASNAIAAAQEEVRRCESAVENSKTKVSENKSNICETKNKIKQKEINMEKICTELQSVKNQRESLIEFQIEVRRAVHCLSVLSGKASVIESHTRRFILQEPVVKLMEDVKKAVVNVTENQLLSSERLLKLTDEMKENNRKLTPICYY